MAAENLIQEFEEYTDLHFVRQEGDKFIFVKYDEPFPHYTYSEKEMIFIMEVDHIINLFESKTHLILVDVKNDEFIFKHPESVYRFMEKTVPKEVFLNRRETFTLQEMKNLVNTIENVQ